MFVKCRKVSKVKRVIIVISLIILFCVILTLVCLRSISPLIVEYSRAKVKSISVTAVNNAVMEVMNKPYKYADLISIEKDSSGKVTFIEANSISLNHIARDSADTVQKYLVNLSANGVKIPLGNLTNWAIFTGLGPKINIELLPTENVVCNFESEFESAGINQTRHKLYLNVITTIELIIPTYKAELVNTTQILLAECVIVGEVPKTYLNFPSK